MRLSNIDELKSLLDIDRLYDFSLFVGRRLLRDHCASVSASLTYTTLLATIPFFIVSLSIVSQFSAFQGVLNNLQTAMLQIFTPDIGQEFFAYIQSIIRKGRGLPVLSFIVVFASALMMLYTIDEILNRIWQVEYRRRTWFRFLVYLLVIVSGPILLGVSLVVTAYLFSISSQAVGAEGIRWITSVPWLVTFIAFSNVYRWVPNTHVKWRYALVGGFIAMLFFELAKWGFALYIRWVPTYNLLYGTLAAIPLTLVWLYISWFIVLIGAETTRCLATYKYGVEEADLTARQLLGFFHRTRGGEATRDQIVAWGYLGKRRVTHILTQLQENGFISELAPGKYVLTDKSREMGLEQLRLVFMEQLKLVGN